LLCRTSDGAQREESCDQKQDLRIVVHLVPSIEYSFRAFFGWLLFVCIFRWLFIRCTGLGCPELLQQVLEYNHVCLVVSGRRGDAVGHLFRLQLSKSVEFSVIGRRSTVMYTDVRSISFRSFSNAVGIGNSCHQWKSHTTHAVQVIGCSILRRQASRHPAKSSTNASHAHNS
jgi:hypothetical protein